MTVDERGRAAASALLESTRHDLEAFAMLHELTDSPPRPTTSPRRGVIAALSAVAVAVALVGGWTLLRVTQTPRTVAAQPSATQSAAPVGPRVVSRVHGYSAAAPAGWTFRAGSTEWKYAADAGAPGVRDSFRSPTAPATIFVSSQLLPAGVSQAQWLTSFLPGEGASMPACFPATPAAWDQRRLSVDGHPAGTWGGDYGCSFTEVVVFAGDRVYDISAQPDPGRVNTDIFDAGVLTAFLASMRLTP